MQLTDIAFAEKGKWGGGLIYYCCGKRHEGRWREFPKASNQEKSKTADMVGLGNFDHRMGKKWDNTHKTTITKVKKGVVQAVVEEDRERNNEDKETVLTSYAQILKANGFINISFHRDANREEFGSFGGDVVSEFGIGFLQIDDASLLGTTSHDQGAAFSDAGKWVAQGGGGTNPVNNQHSQVKNIDATAKTRKAVPYPTCAGDEHIVPLDMGSKKPVLVELHTDRFTLENWKCYLDSCATYHNVFSGSS